MSAQIPETMLLSDLLKPTGYDCPEDFIGKTFAEATAGGDVQTNKAATIDVSAYTEPVVIQPDTDYESMKKTTVTLSNIPQAGATAYAWVNSDKYVYLNVATAPDAITDIKCIAIGSPDNSFEVIALSEGTVGEYAKVSDTEFTIGEGTYTRDSTKDAVLWG